MPAKNVIPESAVGGYPGSRLRQSSQFLFPSLNCCLLPPASCKLYFPLPYASFYALLIRYFLKSAYPVLHFFS